MLCKTWALPELMDGLCTHCGICVEACPNHGIHLDDDGIVFDKRDTCDACGSCEDACPEGAIVTQFEIADASQDSASKKGRDEH